MQFVLASLIQGVTPSPPCFKILSMVSCPWIAVSFSFLWGSMKSGTMHQIGDVTLPIIRFWEYPPPPNSPNIIIGVFVYPCRSVGSCFLRTHTHTDTHTQTHTLWLHIFALFSLSHDFFFALFLLCHKMRMPLQIFCYITLCYSLVALYFFQVAIQTPYHVL